ncbi:Zinc finger protein [Wickerhamomyces ciferrii]|uniref:Zinc finger protein n=1 Tax=Wickerhamomyces ciferrii (strain ATCC 14091 / BCRC 22168 / CBS 111 / JCM 3599 / NBRC 0793 / NRRL Y-1031 F-60-10) TaxID=1206466 RepID=K0KTU2_WICCF|nr:Zinc finger protein [Wickerhamomyces ciferrii]CCH45442.1 Zinc finger protein [Wickerhamomyces ciferrii]
MTSLALFPHLRRTLTDVMEDELYHVPNNVASNNSNSTQQYEDFNQSLSQQQITAPFHHLNNSSNSLNKFSSPTLSNSKLFKNSSALNSEEMLTIPDQQIPLNQHHQQHSQQQQQQQQQSELSRVQSHDMYYDIPEPLPQDDEQHIFNEFADPNLTTTQHYNSQHQIPQDPSTIPTKLLKFNDDLSLDYFINDDNDDSDSKFIIYPALSPTMIPEEIEDEELSDDDEDDTNEFTYLDNTLNDDKNPLNYQHQQYQKEQDLIQKQEYQMIKQQEFNSQQKSNLQFKKFEYKDDSITQDLESDIDRMSLDSSDDEYSSNSSVLDEDSYTPIFQTSKPTTSLSPPIPTPNQSKSRRSSTIQQQTPLHTSPSQQHTQHTQHLSTSPSQQQNSHQCQLINPSTNQICLKQFSRPYDLIRHQETIHASRKKIFRCIVCNKLEGGLSNKTFSRGDALSRHIRVKHGLTGNEATDALQYAKDNVEYV